MPKSWRIAASKAAVTVLLTLLMAAWPARFTSAAEPGGGAASLMGDARPVQPVADAAMARTSGEQLLASVIRQVDAVDSISAKARQRVDLFGTRIVGAGNYLQQGRGDARMTRFELQMQSHSDDISLLEINVDDYLWRQQRLPHRTEVTKVNLRRVRLAWQKAERAAGQRPAFDFSRPSKSFGGLPKLLAELEKSFRFGNVRETEIISGASKLPVYEVVGHWLPDRLAAMLPDQSESILKGQPVDLSKLPSHIPHEVMLVVDRATLFPYVFEYRRYDAADDDNDAAATGAAAPFKRIAWLQLFDVEINQPVNSQMFIFNPGPDTEVRDITDDYLPPPGETRSSTALN